MNLDIKQLQDRQKYCFLYELDHRQITTFAQSELKKRNIFTISYFVFNAIFLGMLGFFVASDLLSKKVVWDNVVLGLCTGIFFCFSVIILIHELLHVGAYKLVGAKNTAIQANWKQFVFVAVADKFIANSKEFYFIALLPFTVINSLLIMGLFLTTGFWFYLLLGALAFHSLACGGDFALVSYLWENRSKQIITYDDVPEKKSYFYEILNQ